ncbi:hypothetical protein GCM10008967_02370 [Bacillus carboniphilus]|uniref:DUF4352 domain-containing protein n=1 Tax=Bacillus carboniphilus TaxID=86663 RepID=A0ABN0VRC9_9BACI
MSAKWKKGVGIVAVVLIGIWLFGGKVYECVRGPMEGSHRVTVEEGDFQVTLSSEKEIYTVGEDLQVSGSITYTGVKPFSKVYHKGIMFIHFIRGIDHEYEKGFFYREPLVSSYLFRDVSHREDFGFAQPYVQLPPGKYSIEVVTDFWIKDDPRSEVAIPIQIEIEVVE